MKKLNYLFAPLAVLAIAAIAFGLLSGDGGKTSAASQLRSHQDLSEEDLSEPYDFLFHQRSYPDKTLDVNAYTNVMRQVSRELAAGSNARMASNASWTVEGPVNIGGRINSVISEPGNPSVMYAGCATGGIFKTVNHGVTWSPIFDAQPSLSIGCLAMDPANSSVLWAGTGDANISGYPFIGDGIYKSTNGGVTWTNMGLAATRVISKIIIDPSNSNIVYAACMGLPFVRDTNRGLYKTTDGGLTWNQVLFVDIDAGIIDMVMDPTNPQVIYAASYNCIRNNQEKIYYGPDSKIWKTVNGGTTWNALSGGLPTVPLSRIGLAVSSVTPNTVFALVIDSTFYLEGIYKSSNGGNTWIPLQISTFDQQTGPNGFGWYFGKIYVNPVNDNQLYVPGVDMQTTTDGGLSWFPATPPWWMYLVHADGHCIQFTNSSTLLYCTDGGLYETPDNGITWNDIDEIPNTQFYRVTHNPFHPGQYYGGAQDNGTTGGNSSILNGWPRIFGGDGFQPYYHPQDSNLSYVETQNGNIRYSDDGGFSYFDGTFGIDTADRRSWDMPYVMGAVTPSTLHTGTYRVYEMTSAPYSAWMPISGDLTDGIVFDPRFHVISALNQSVLDEQVLYAGTSDGNVWVTQNDGIGWNNITSTLPDRYVTSVHASPNVVSNVFVTHSGYKSNDYIPHVHKSLNYGSTWTDISGNLPQAAVNDIEVLPGNDSSLFVASDAGVYYTIDGGSSWTRVGNNMPVVPVYDIEYNATTGRLAAGTFARSLWSIDVNQVITGIREPVAEIRGLRLFPVPVTGDLSVSWNGSSGASIFLYDDGGKLVYQAMSPGQIVLDMHAFKSGTYFLRIDSGGKRATRKFLKL